MLEIDLPIVESDTSLVDAIKKMHSQNVSGIYVRDDKSPKVFDIGTVVHRLRVLGNRKIGSFKPRLKTLKLSDDILPVPSNLTDDRQKAIEDLMDKAGASFAVTISILGVSKILSRYEALGNSVTHGASMIWMCSDESPHYLDTNQLNDGNLCMYCGKPARRL